MSGDHRNTAEWFRGLQYAHLRRQHPLLCGLTGALLLEAEAAYGKRAPGWTFLGAEFVNDPYAPATLYPLPDDQTICIILTESAEHSPEQLLFQLAHEVVHLLGPAGPGRRASRLEEGVASNFAVALCARLCPHYEVGSGGSYAAEQADTNALLSLHPSAVPDIRARVPIFADITPTDLRSVAPSAPEELLTRLCEPATPIRPRL